MLLALFVYSLMACLSCMEGLKICLESFENQLNFQGLKCFLQSYEALLSLAQT